jgi:muconolactone D-isomerase
MLFYSKMHWELKGMNFDQLWDLEGQEAKAGIESVRQGFVKHLYKVSAEQYVIAIGESASVEDFDQYSMGILPMREHLTFEEVWALEEGFTIDVATYLNERRPKMKQNPKFLYFIQLSWSSDKRIVDENWDKMVQSLKQSHPFKALGVYRVASRQKVIAIVDVTSANELNELAMIPTLQSPDVEKVWALRDYEGFANDVMKHYKFDNDNK